jgi:hypothetical protein
LDSRRARETVDWTYGECRLDSGSEKFGPFRGLMELWNDRREGESELPPRSALDFYDFKDWLGRVSIARIEREPFQVRFVLWGTKLAELWGVDYTNKLLGELSETPEAWVDVELAYFKRMAERPFIGIVQGSLMDHRKSYVHILGIDLPLGSAAGLTHVLSVHMAIERREDHFSRFPVSRVL